MKTEVAKTIYLKDYQPTPFSIDSVELLFDIFDDHTLVKSKLSVSTKDRSSTAKNTRQLILDGSELELLSITVNGQPWQNYSVDEHKMVVSGVPNEFTLETVSKIFPAQNKSCEGLYLSSGNYFTQCEAEGFRKITWFYDRPDVMARYKVSITAEKVKFPRLLSNGNLIEKVDLASGRHLVVWEDPFPKPCYLFALVAGDLDVLQDRWVTFKDREVTLEIYARREDIAKCRHGLESLKQALKWDEEIYGLECDLDNYKIVAVGDFNMGAMENKGLNIFNTSCILASAETTVDDGFDNVQATVAHEYFHNWSGNRVTCRDWFQLCLKEGFTVFRHQEFSGDVNSRSVQRIRDVNSLRSRQFVEDAGPMSHPVRPESFIEINNFYTTTVYEKGAEICRMIALVLGKERFRKGTDLYFSKYDGQAVTIEDFLSALSEGAGVDVRNFVAWYGQAGTPHLKVRQVFDQATKKVTLKFSQSGGPSLSLADWRPLPITVAMSLFDVNGRQIEMIQDGKKLGKQTVVLVDALEKSFVFEGVLSEPVPSLLRDFSAPVVLDQDLNEKSRFVLMKNDTDSFNRWEMGQQIMADEIIGMYSTKREARSEVLIGMQSLLVDESISSQFKALALELPSLEILQQKVLEVHYAELWEARMRLLKTFALKYSSEIKALYDSIMLEKDYRFHPVPVGERALKNSLLNLLGFTEFGEKAVYDQFNSASNMTELLGSLKVACDFAMSHSQKFLGSFFEKFKDEPLVVDGWFRLQASSASASVSSIKKLLAHPAYHRENPNRARSVLSALSISNLPVFHHESGEGYSVLCDEILLIDKHNPQIAARLARGFGTYKKSVTKEKAMAVLSNMATKPLSKDLFEVIENMLHK
jgi:aminopeptidase N